MDKELNQKGKELLERIAKSSANLAELIAEKKAEIEIKK